MIAGHGVINARAGQDEAVVAAEGGNHDRGGHGERAGFAEDRAHRRDRDPILRRVLDSIERQHRDVSKIRENVKDNDECASAQQCAREIPAGIAHFTADESDIRPGCLREERPDHRFAEEQDERETADDGEAGLRCLRAPPVFRRVPPIR